MQRRRLPLAAACSLAAAGCGGHLQPQPLSTSETAEIVAVEASLAGRPVSVAAGSGEVADRVARVLGDHGFDASTEARPGSVTLHVEGPIDRVPGEPWVGIVTLLPIPVWSGATEYRMTSAASAPSVCDTTGTIAWGPVGLLVAVLPGWRSWMFKVWAGDGAADCDARLALCAARALAGVATPDAR